MRSMPAFTRTPPVTLFVALLLLLAPVARAQNVVTFASGVGGVKDFGWDASGQMYATGVGGGTGNVYTIGAGGSPVTPLNSTFINPWGLAFSPAGDMYVADGGNPTVVSDGKVYKVASNGTKTTFVAGLGDPMFIHFAPNGDLFVGEWGGRKIWRVSPAGVATLFASQLGGTGDQVGDFVIEPSGAILVGVGPNIVELSPGGLVTGTFASGLGGVVGMLPLNQGDFFVSRYSARDVWYVNPSGVGSHWTGVGGSCTDGTLSTAVFGYTSGLHRRGNVLYIGAASCNAIKTIDLDQATSTGRTTWGRLKSHYR